VAISETYWDGLGLAVERTVKRGGKGGALDYFAVMHWSGRGQGTPSLALRGREGKVQGTREVAGVALHYSVQCCPLLLSSLPVRCSTKWPQEIFS